MADLAILMASRATAIRNSIAQLRRHSRLKLLTIAAAGTSVWSILFVVFFSGFRFIHKFPAIEDQLNEYLFALFYLSLFLMLLFSNGIISFSSLFRSAESRFLMTLPARGESIFFHRMFESLVFSTWAFALVAAPMLIAFGVINGAHWLFYPGAFVATAVFVFLPCTLGAITALLIARFVPKTLRGAIVVLVVVAILAGLMWTIHWLRGLSYYVHSADQWLSSVLNHIAFCLSPALPSQWLSRSLLSLAHGKTSDGLFFLFVLSSNTMMALWVAYHAARKMYVCVWQDNHTPTRQTVGRLAAGMARIVERVAFLLPDQVRLFIGKDFLLFIRDPVQWSQSLVFFGLLLMYFLNLRNLSYHLANVEWKTTIAFLNLGATTLTLATFTTRFVYPQLSLEGRKFWILGLMPIERKSILYAKFHWSWMTSVFLSLSLILISDVMLRVPGSVIVLHTMTVVMISIGLSGLATGLGALTPNFREDNPSKIVAGFGGTLNLILSLAFVVIVLLLTAVPCYAQMSKGWENLWFVRALTACVLAAATLLTYLAASIPMTMGRRALETMEI